MNRILPVILFIFGTGIAFPENQPELPMAAKRLVEELERWTSAQREDIDKRIGLKNVEIAGELKRHLEAATKTGDLDGAITIRKKISELEAEALPATPAELSDWLQGRKIEFVGASGRHVIEFKRDSTVLYHEKKSGQTISYRALSSRSVELKWESAYKLKYSDDMTTATFVTPAGNYPVKTEPKG